MIIVNNKNVYAYMVAILQKQGCYLGNAIMIKYKIQHYTDLSTWQLKTSGLYSPLATLK